MADTFTAITEDRPYRKGMDNNEALGVLTKLVDNGGLDGQVVDTLGSHFDAINAIRQEEQDAYKVKQQSMARVISAAEDVVSATAISAAPYRQASSKMSRAGFV